MVFFKALKFSQYRIFLNTVSLDITCNVNQSLFVYHILVVNETGWAAQSVRSIIHYLFKNEEAYNLIDSHDCYFLGKLWVQFVSQSLGWYSFKPCLLLKGYRLYHEKLFLKK